MAETRGTFILSEILLESKEDNWVPPEEVFINADAANTGYFGGGNAGGSRSTMDKVTYSSDTTAAVPGANLSVARINLAATGNSTAGYFGGGSPGAYSTMEKVSYAADTSAIVPGAALSAARSYLAATGNSAVGYFGGGGSGSPIVSNSTVDKVTYSTDTTASAPTTAFLTVARRFLAATGNQTAGYFGGGFGAGTPGIYSTMDKVTYSTDTISTVPGASLSLARTALAATGNSTAGYFGGGSGPHSTMDKVTYSSDTTAAVPGANLSSARSRGSATGSSTVGYFGGGDPLASTMDKIIYSNDTRVAAIPGLSLSAARYSLAASSLRANGLPSIPVPNVTRGNNFISNTTSFNSGYFGGGITQAPAFVNFSTMDKVTYSTDTRTTVPGANLTVARSGSRATGSTTAGYFGGGYIFSPVSIRSTTDKVTYSSDTTAAVPGASLSAARAYHAATGNSTAGYFGGGYNPNGGISYTTTDKLTYSSDTTAAVPGAALSIARTGGYAATGNSTAGYFGGGFSPGSVNYSTMDKVTYSSDTRATVPSASLSAARYNIAATGNSTAGYFGGGGPVSTMDKVIYSTDTRTSVPGANLTVGRQSLAATGNSATGYFGGGFNSYTTMDKVTYSTDTTATVPGAALSVGRYNLNASSSTANAIPQQDFTTTTPQAIQGNTGYFGGGVVPGPTPAAYSTMDKVSYSTDTTAAVPGAALSIARSGSGATGNSTSGYFGGGFGTGTPGYRSTMDKVTYSSDTTAAVPGANLSVARNYPGATGNSRAGYFGGGSDTGPVYNSSMDKVTYSTDTTAAVPGAALSVARDGVAATGNSTSGYFGGGFTSGPASFSTIDKVTYSSDTRTTVPGAALSVARSGLAATGNSTAGYFGGGVVPGPTNALYSTMDRVTYSTDTRTTVPGAALSVARNSLAASSSVANDVRGTVPQVTIV